MDVSILSNNNNNLNISKKEPDKLHRVRSIFHVHGSLEEDMVLGVDKPSQIANEKLSNNVDAKHLLVKPECNSAMRHGVELNCENRIKAADLICIFGSSIGETDQIWWNQIADQLKNKNCRLIIFDYNPTFSKRRSHLLERFKKETLKKFFNSEDVEEMSERVHFSLNSNMFQLIKDY
jgi:hypothetical protein